MKSLDKTVNKFINNIYVLYFITFLAIVHVFNYIVEQNWTFVILFGLLSFLTKHYNSNMVIVFLSAIIGTNLIYAIGNSHMKEGMSTSRRSKKSKVKAIKIIEENDDDDYEDENNKAPAIDRTETNKAAFTSLQDMLGKQGIKNLNSDTTDLIEKQNSLSESMKAMGPLMDQANKMLEKVDIEKMTKMSSILNKFK